MHATSPSGRSATERKVREQRGHSWRRSMIVGLVLIALTLATAIALLATGTVPLGSTTSPPPPKPSDVMVNFDTTAAVNDPAAVGVDESTYGAPSDIQDRKAQAMLKKLGIGYSRIWLTLANPADPASRITCAAQGCDTKLNIDSWIRMMEAAGEAPLVGIPDTLSAADAAAIVTHFASASFSHPVTDWVIGNEPNGYPPEGATTYDANFNTLYGAMKQADPSIKIGGPATLNFDQPFLQQFLKDCGSRADFVDFHFYPAHETAAQLLAGLPVLSQDLATLRDMIKATVPSRASAIAIHVGEWNFSADPGTLAQYAFTGFASVLDADILGRILTAGADSLAWSTKNGRMSLIYGDLFGQTGPSAPSGYKSDSPMPLYEAIGMFTGQGLFPRFGDKVAAATSKLPGIDAFASSKPDEIVLVNTNPKAKRLTLRTIGGNWPGVIVWQLDQTGAVAGPPVKKGTVTGAGGYFKITLPGDSVTTLVMTTHVPKRK